MKITPKFMKSKLQSSDMDVALFPILVSYVVYSSSMFCYLITRDSLYPIGTRVLTTGFTNGNGQIWLDQVACRGGETRLIDCPANAIGTHDCSHTEDIGLTCQPLGGSKWRRE